MFKNRMGSIGRRFLAPVLYTSATFLTMVAFQNCSQPMQPDDSSSVTTQAAKLDFSYDSTIDEVAHMSCPALVGSNADSAFFTFRAGAFLNGGVMLTPAFFTTLKKNILDDQISILSSSPANTNALLQLSLRSRSNFQQIRTSSGSARAGQDYANIFAPLGTEELSKALIELPQNSRLNYLTDVTDTRGSRMEGNLNFDSTKLDDIRNHLNSTTGGDEFLTLTYSTGSSGVVAQSPFTLFKTPGTDVTKNVYGKGYAFGFVKPAVSNLSASFPANVLGSVTESNLISPTDRTSVSPWTCSSTYQFRIVREEDLATATTLAKPGVTDCVKAPDPVNPTNPNDWKIVRGILRQENYYIDMTHHCAIPKNGSTGCYATLVPTYAAADQCDKLGVGNPACAGYVSICVRSN
jgi:hypothetical protein